MSTEAIGPFSVYRGQADSGIGKGPGRPILRGEQYLAADEPLYDSDLLETIRPWLTLDSDPADVRRLGDRLEAWSVFEEGVWRFVVSLRLAGTYDVRASYFAHGRAWRAEALTSSFDPGVYVGRPAAFDRPWREAGSRPEDARLPSPTDLAWDAVATEPDAAARLLAHLLQARHTQSALVVAAPLEDFASSSLLPQLVAFARAALPRPVKEGCKVRIYTRLPELFLRQLRADLVVVPDDLAREALMARRDATLIGRTGEHLSGPPLDAHALAWAQAVVARVRALPEGLLDFSERSGRGAVALGLPTAAEVCTVQLTYNLAYALAGPPARRQGLLEDFLLPKAQELGALPWHELVAPEEWSTFSRGELYNVFLRSSEQLTPGGQALKAGISEALGQQSTSASGDDLASWFRDSPPDVVAHQLPSYLRHLAEGHPAVHPSVGVELGRRFPLEDLARAGPVLGVLRAELEAGALSARGREAPTLARLAAEDPRILEVLVQGTGSRGLDDAWVFSFLGVAGEPSVLELATRVVADPTTWNGFDRVLKDLLDRLRRWPSPPQELRELAIRAGAQADPVAQFGLFVRLFDLVAGLDRVFSTEASNPLLLRLQDALPRVSKEKGDRTFLCNLLGDPTWPALGPELLVSHGGEPTVPWAREEALAFLGSAPLRQRLNPEALVGLAQSVLSEMDDRLLGKVYEALDTCFREHPLKTTEALVAHHWWFAWRQRAKLSAEDAHVAALAWLGSRAWRRDKDPEAPLEAWELAIADLERTPISERELAVLGDGNLAPGWPWIPPFEQTQLEAIRKLPTETVWHLVGELLRRGERQPGFPAGEWLALRERFQARLGQGSYPGPAPAGATRSLAARVTEALFAGRATDACWRELAEQVGSFQEGPGQAGIAEHPVLQLEREVRQKRGSLNTSTRESLLETLSQVVAQYHALADRAPGPDPLLPLLSVVAELCGPGALGQAAEWVLTEVCEKQITERAHWWNAFFRSIPAYHRYGTLRSGEDCCDLALVMISRMIQELPLTQQRAARAGREAWQQTLRPPFTESRGVIL